MDGGRARIPLFHTYMLSTAPQVLVAPLTAQSALCLSCVPALPLTQPRAGYTKQARQGFAPRRDMCYSTLSTNPVSSNGLLRFTLLRSVTAGTPGRLSVLLPRAQGSTSEATNGVDIGMHPDAIRRRMEAEQRKQRRMAYLRQRSVRFQPNDLPENAQYIIQLDVAQRLFGDVMSDVDGEKLTVVWYTAPWCPGCKSLYPKVLQIAKNNPSINFVMMCLEDEPLRNWVHEVLHVSKMPFFQLYLGGSCVSSFTANLTTISVLRAEIAAASPCTDDHCAYN